MEIMKKRICNNPELLRLHGDEMALKQKRKNYSEARPEVSSATRDGLGKHLLEGDLESLQESIRRKRALHHNRASTTSVQRQTELAINQAFHKVVGRDASDLTFTVGEKGKIIALSRDAVERFKEKRKRMEEDLLEKEKLRYLERGRYQDRSKKISADDLADKRIAKHQVLKSDWVETLRAAALQPEQPEVNRELNPDEKNFKDFLEHVKAVELMKVEEKLRKKREANLKADRARLSGGDQEGTRDDNSKVISDNEDDSFAERRHPEYRHLDTQNLFTKAGDMRTVKFKAEISRKETKASLAEVQPSETVSTMDDGEMKVQLRRSQLSVADKIKKHGNKYDYLLHLLKRLPAATPHMANGYQRGGMVTYMHPYPTSKDLLFLTSYLQRILDESRRELDNLPRPKHNFAPMYVNSPMMREYEEIKRKRQDGERQTRILEVKRKIEKVKEALMAVERRRTAMIDLRGRQPNASKVQFDSDNHEPAYEYQHAHALGKRPIMGANTPFSTSYQITLEELQRVEQEIQQVNRKDYTPEELMRGMRRQNESDALENSFR